MSYGAPRDHLFLYHAYALALGGWMKDKNGNLTTIDSVAPSVLSIAGGFGSASVHNLNCGAGGKFPFGESGPEGFSVYVGHAYTEVRGVEDEELGIYKTTVRSVLDNVRINDVFGVEHAEAILMSTHGKPDHDSVEEGKVVVGDSNMSGVRVAGKGVGLEKRDGIDSVPSYGALKLLGPASIASLCDWNDPAALPPGASQYAIDIATINQKSQNHLSFSLFKDVVLPETPGARAFKSSIDVDGFGRIFFGEVMASHGMKQVTMFRIDLGCDNCGGVGGSDGTTNGSSIPP
jgi:hypothetical protein